MQLESAYTAERNSNKISGYVDDEDACIKKKWLGCDRYETFSEVINLGHLTIVII